MHPTPKSGSHGKALRGPCSILWAILLAACGSGDIASEAYLVRDSAGVQIVESFGPAWGPGDGWWVSDVPRLHIGVIEGAEEYRFTIVAGVWRRGDGSVVAADGRSASIRIYDSAGRFVTGFGSQGDGPGEFRQITSISPYRGDSILATGVGRYAIYDSEGRLGRSGQIELPPPEVHGTGGLSLQAMGGMGEAFSDGSFLVRPGTVVRGEPGGMAAMPLAFVRYSPEVQLEARLADVAGSPIRLPTPGGGPTPPTPYSRQTVSAVRGTDLYLGRGASFEIEQRRADGSLERVLRAHHLDLTLGESHREAFRRFQLESPPAQSDPAGMERLLREVEYPAAIPPYSQALVDSEDHLWVRHYGFPGSTLAQVWSVFAPEGYLLGTVATPERFQLRQIGPDYVLGIWMDEFDVRHLREYPLQRGR